MIYSAEQVMNMALDTIRGFGFMPILYAGIIIILVGLFFELLSNTKES
jgi:hypothetical protein